MSEIIEFKTKEMHYSLLVSDKPTHWANGIYVQIYTGDGERINAISYASHPEFENFDLYKNMTNAELIEVVLLRIETDINSHDYKVGAANGIELLLPINKKI